MRIDPIIWIKDLIASLQGTILQGPWDLISGMFMSVFSWSWDVIQGLLSDFIEIITSFF